MEPTLIELSSALQPIALAYLAAFFLARVAPRVQAAVAVGIMAGYTLLLGFVSAPGVPAGSYEKGANLVRFVDLAVLGRAHVEGGAYHQHHSHARNDERSACCSGNYY